MPMESDENKKGGTQVRRAKGLFFDWHGWWGISQKIHGFSDDIAILKLYELAYRSIKKSWRRMARCFSQHDSASAEMVA